MAAVPHPQALRARVAGGSYSRRVDFRRWNAPGGVGSMLLTSTYMSVARGEGGSAINWPRSCASAYSTSCFSGLVPSAPTQTMLRMTSGSPMPNDHRMPKYSAM